MKILHLAGDIAVLVTLLKLHGVILLIFPEMLVFSKMLNTCPTENKMATEAISSSSSSASISPTNDIPNRKRQKNWRRSTGPLSPDDLQMAMLETEKESNDGIVNSTTIEQKSALVESGKQQECGDSSKATLVQEQPSLTVTVASENNNGEKKLIGTRINGRYTLTKMDSLLLCERRLNRSTTSGSCQSYLEIDYRKLYELEQMENDRLRTKLQYLESLMDAGNFTLNNERQIGFSESKIRLDQEKSLERRLVELEEEVKVVDALRSDNQRLKEENGALIRVISKLSK